MIQIIPSILTNDPVELKKMLDVVEKVHLRNKPNKTGDDTLLIDRVSVDIIDGKYANNKTIEPSILEDIETTLKIDYQLMVVEPINWIERCVRGQADRIIGHVEKMGDQVEFVGKVQEVGALVGLGMDLNTKVSDVDPTILTNLDTVLVMSVKAGFGGQKFEESVLKKIKKLSELKKEDSSPYKIHVDGGITFDNISKAAKAGCDEVSVGRRLFKGNLEENIEKFNKLVK